MVSQSIIPLKIKIYYSYLKLPPRGIFCQTPQKVLFVLPSLAFLSTLLNKMKDFFF